MVFEEYTYIIYTLFQMNIKRVERASTDAAREVFGNNYQSILEQVHVDDDALVEGTFTLCFMMKYHCMLMTGPTNSKVFLLRFMIMREM